MCTYQTYNLPLTGSGKGPASWSRLGSATVYFDHPVHAPSSHTLNIDFGVAGGDRGSRVALELEPGAAEALARSILEALEAAPFELRRTAALPTPR